MFTTQKTLILLLAILLSPVILFAQLGNTRRANSGETRFTPFSRSYVRILTKKLVSSALLEWAQQLMSFLKLKTIAYSQVLDLECVTSCLQRKRLTLGWMLVLVKTTGV